MLTTWAMFSLTLLTCFPTFVHPLTPTSYICLCHWLLWFFQSRENPWHQSLHDNLLFVFLDHKQRNTFQAVAATDGCQTFGLFLYNGSMAWSVNSIIGASDGNGRVLTVDPATVLSGFSGTRFARLAACTGSRQLLLECESRVNRNSISPAEVGLARRVACPRNYFQISLNPVFHTVFIRRERECFSILFPQRRPTIYPVSILA